MFHGTVRVLNVSDPTISFSATQVAAFEKPVVKSMNAFTVSQS